jgi:tetratricopeptide (TPR) repeat protein
MSRRPARVPPRRALLLACLPLLLAGCATVKKVPLAPASPLLVVDGVDGDRDAEIAATRALALAPVRAWPTDADPGLASELAGDPAERVERARTAAEERRLPWLLVLEGPTLRLETARGGRVVWRGRLRRDGDVAATLSRRMGHAAGLLAGPGETRLLPADELAALRGLAVDGDWTSYSARVDSLAAAWPADPAVRTHVGLRDHMTSQAGDLSALELASSMGADAESELLAVAVAAEAADATGLALTARAALVRLHPERIDYRPRLADAQELLGRPEDALSTCRGAPAVVDRDALLALPKGSAPDDAPQALPFADLAYCAGYHLFEAGSWEQAALAYEDAIELYEAFGRWRELGESLNNAGVAMVQAERPLMAASVLRKAVDVREELGHPLPLANSRYNLGRALADANKPAAARLSLQRAADDYRAGDEPWEALDTLLETLDLLVEEDDRDGFVARGQELLESAAAMPEGEQQEELVGWIWFELGQGRLTFGDAEGSMAAYLRSLRTWEALGRRLEQGQAHYSMALPHLAMHEFTEAHTDLLRALAISVELADSTSILAIREQLEEIEDLMDQAVVPIPPIPDELRIWLGRDAAPAGQE